MTTDAATAPSIAIEADRSLSRVPVELRSLRIWVTTFAVWSVIAVLSATIRWMYYGSKEQMSLAQSFGYSICDEYVNALLTPPMLWLGRVFRVTRENWRRMAPRQLLIAVIAGAFSAAPSTFVTDRLAQSFGHPGWQWETAQHEIVGCYLGNVVWMSQILLVSQGLLSIKESRERAVRAVQLEAQLAKAQLQVLRMQLNPHFLFNTLNGIVTLMHRDIDAAERMILRLSDLLRLALDDDGSLEVPLRREVDFMERYLDLEKVRFAERLHVTVRLADDTLDCLVPNLILHPIVENAVKHGVARTTDGGHIELRTYLEDGRLTIDVEDDGPGFDEARSGGGIGLTNTRERLSRMFGSEARLDVGVGPRGGARVRLRLPVRMQSRSKGSEVAT